MGETNIILADPRMREFKYSYVSTVIPHSGDIVYIHELDQLFNVEKMITTTHNGIMLIGALLHRNGCYRDLIDEYFKHE